MGTTSDKFPWELLKAECLRLVCVQLVEASSEGQKSFKPARKEDMVTFLRDVHERGGKASNKTNGLYYLLAYFAGLVITALEDVERKIIDSITLQQASPSKRKSVHVDEDDDHDEEEEEEDAGDDSDNINKNGGEGYNTRYKGVKRVKVHGFSPERNDPKPKRKVGRPRRSVVVPAVVEGDAVVVEARKRGRPRLSGVGAGGGETIKVSKGKRKSLENGDAAAAADVVTGEVVISRPRGRPRKKKIVIETNGNGVPEKKPLHSANNAPVSKDSAREVFDGVVLVKRNKNRTEEAVGDVDGDGEVLNNDERDGSEEDAVIAVVNGDDAQGDLSSLGGSNKGENNF